MQTDYYHNQLAVQINEDMIIKKVIVNNYDDIEMNEGESIIHLFSDEHQKTFLDQFSETMNQEISLGKRIEFKNHQTSMMFTIKEEHGMTIFAFSLSDEINDLLDELVEINNQQTQSIRDLYQKLARVKDGSVILEEIMKVNNSLINTRRELSIKNQKLKQLNDKLEKVSNIDYLTKTYNRRKFNHDITEAITNEKTILVMLDFNNFKYVNDQYGHDKGDDLLCFFTEHLSHILSEYDAVLYRLGGDEFAVLANQEKNFPIETIIQNVNDEIKKKYEEVSLSYGKVVLPKSDSNPSKVIEDCLRNADSKMYQMKHNFYDKKENRRYNR